MPEVWSILERGRYERRNNHFRRFRDDHLHVGMIEVAVDGRRAKAGLGLV